jgi:hypothetical protein
MVQRDNMDKAKTAVLGKHGKILLNNLQAVNSEREKKIREIKNHDLQAIVWPL